MNELAARRAQDDDDAESIPQEVIDKIKAEHPGLEMRVIETEDADGGYKAAAVFKAPTKGEYKRWRQMMAEPTQRLEANEAITLGCLVYPSVTEVRTILEKRPGYADSWADKLTDWAGAGQKTSVKKI